MSDPGFLGYFLERLLGICGWLIPVFLLLVSIGSWINQKFRVLARIRERLDK